MFSKLWPDRMPSPWRLGMLMLLVVLVILLTILIFVRIAVLQEARTMNRSRIADDLHQHAVWYEEGGLEGLIKVFQVSQPLDRNGLRVTTRTGQVLHEDIPGGMKTYPWPQLPRRTLLGKGDMDLVEITGEETPYRLQAGAILLWDGNILWLGRTDARSRRFLLKIEQHIWFAGLTAALIAFLPVMWFLSDVLRPIQSFTLSAERMRLPGSRTRLRAPKAIPELKALSSVVNSGLDQIQTLTRELQSTNDFLAHELRTPLARIRGNLEHLHDETDNATARESAARGLEEIDRATQLVQTLLTIRAGDHAALRLHRQVTSLDQMLSNLVELFIPAAEDRRLTLKLVTGLSLTLNMDRELLTQAVSNLLDNALAYTRAGGYITVRWQEEGTGAIITVEDTGPGILPEEIDLIWDRYTRGSAARPKTSGMGLGLSLVRSIAMAHGGNAGGQNREGGGAVFWIHIPGA
jgi:signal transduction histidine kinase